MKLEVGMYVRTEKGKIDKIIGFDRALILFLYDLVYGYIDENDIIKASHKIIDILEVGDYVNGVKVDNIILKDDKEICFRYKYAFEKEDVYTLHLEDIKSIVTKEQFSQMEYKVVE